MPKVLVQNVAPALRLCWVLGWVLSKQRIPSKRGTMFPFPWVGDMQRMTARVWGGIMSTLQCCDLCDSFPHSERFGKYGIGCMELALQRWDRYQRCTEQILSGCWTQCWSLWLFWDTLMAPSRLLLLVLCHPTDAKIRGICKACVPFNGNHKSQRASEKYRAWLPCCIQCFTCSFPLLSGE